MLDRLFYLQAALVNHSYSVADLVSGIGVSSTVRFPFDYSIQLTVPYLAFIIFDLGAYIMSFVLMMVYARRAQTTNPGQLADTMRLRGQQLGLVLLIGYVLVGFFIPAISSPIYFFNGLYSIGAASHIWKVGLILVWLVWVSFFTRHYPAQLAEIVILASLSLSFSITLLSTNHFILVFLVLEGLSLVSYIMAAAGRQYGSINGATQYFIYGSLGSMILLLGLVILYSSFRVMYLSVWTTYLELGYLSIVDPLGIFSLSVSSILVVGGLLVKFGAAPLHGWVVETYANVSYHVMWFFSLFIKLVMGLLVLRLLHAVPVFALTEVVGLLSLFIGCVGALRQSEIKRLFAYGSVMHVGFLLLADFVGFQVYLIAYILSMSLIGLVITNLRLNGQEVIYLSDVARALVSGSTIWVPSLIIGLLSVGGVPPLAGFWGKFSAILPLLTTGLSDPLWGALSVLSVVSVTLVAFFYYFRLAVWVSLGLLPLIASRGHTDALEPAQRYTVALFIIVLLGFGYILGIVYDLFILTF